MPVEKTFFVKAQNGKYLIDGEVAPKLELISGKTYEFDLSDPSLSSHPLKFKLSGSSWNDGVQSTGTLSVNQVVALTAPGISDGIISYYCANHSGMGNDLSITWNSIYGTYGDDELYGGDGDDNLQGGAGNDTLDGGDGGDTLTGGAGNDTLSGGLGSDEFIFNTGFGNDIITDFAHGLDELKFHDANGELLSSKDISESQNNDGDAVLKVTDGSSVTLSGVSGYSLPFSISSQKSGNEVTVSFYLDPNKDPGDAGVGSFNATVGFETGSLTYVSSSFADGFTGIPNATEASTGTLGFGAFGLSPVTDLNIPLFSVTFNTGETSELGQIVLSDIEVDTVNLAGGTYSIDLSSSTLSGTVRTRSETGLFDVLLQTDTGVTTETSSSGSFEMDIAGSAQALNGTLSFANTGSTKAISAADALDALKLSVGLSTSAGTKTAYDFISADFNQDGKVSSQDALSILKYSVGLPTPEQAKWVFVDSSGDYSGVSKSNTSYTEGVSIADLSADTTVSLTGILIGDVNDSYSGLIA